MVLEQGAERQAVKSLLLFGSNYKTVSHESSTAGFPSNSFHYINEHLATDVSLRLCVFLSAVLGHLPHHAAEIMADTRFL